MKLAAFSVKCYRSITATARLALGDTTVLIGPNNEGKSNLLNALSTALRVASQLGRLPLIAGRLRPAAFVERRFDYVWNRDFPIALQESRPKGESVFRLEFQLANDEIDQFWSEVRSTLNGNLPIEISLGRKEPRFRVVKRGPGGPALSKKANRIADFIGRRLDFESIPAIRTARAARTVVEDMVARELLVVEQQQEYANAMREISRLQQPVLDAISQKITATLRDFLPRVKSVAVTIPEEKRVRAFRQCEITVDDGTPTALERKGDGVQSLAALSLLRGARQTRASERELILAVEEPESHLHPSAIHRLRDVLNEVSQEHQVILTTHCPLFVNRRHVNANILVEGNKARPAKTIEEIREILGVRASDNLRHATLVLIVEGDFDEQALATLFAHDSQVLSSALSQGYLAIDSLRGAGNLSYKLSALRAALCDAHCFLDYDAEGQRAAEVAIRNGLLEAADIHFATCPGTRESEFEDLLNPACYMTPVQNHYGVVLGGGQLKGRQKWSVRLKRAFNAQGKHWDRRTESSLKRLIADLVVNAPAVALSAGKRGAYDALVGSLENKIQRA